MQRQPLFRQLLFWFLLLILPPFTAYMYSYYKASTVLKQKAWDYLDVVTQTKANAIETYTSGIRKDIHAFAQTMQMVLNSSGNPAEMRAADAARLYDYLKTFIHDLGYYDAFLITPDGDVFFTVAKENDLYTNLQHGKYKDSKLAEAYRRALMGETAEITDFLYYEPSAKPAAFIAAPVIRGERILCIVALQVNNDILYNIINDYTGLGDTGEVITIRSDTDGHVCYAAPCRHAQENLYRKIDASVSASHPFLKALGGETGHGMFTDYRGHTALASWRYLPSLNWGLVTKIDADEAYASIHAMKKLILVLSALMFVLLGLLIYLAAESVAKPINALIDVVKRYGDGDFSARARFARYHEIGKLARTFNDMADRIQEFNLSLESKVAEKTRKIQKYMKVVDDNVITSSTDARGIITSVSSAFCKISGFSEAELLGQSHHIVRHPDMPQAFFEELWKTIKAGKEWNGEIKNLKKDGGFYWVDTHISPLYEGTTIIGYTAIRHDITDKKRVEELSITDEMTGLYNRRHFNKVLPREIARAQRDGKQLGFLVLDVDYFKQYNDTYGHLAGDKVLSEIGAVLKNSAHRASDYAFRLGGEEFGVLFSDMDEKEALKFAENILRRVESLRIDHRLSRASHYVTVSIGLVVRDANRIENQSMLYRNADVALYEAKGAGRNRVIVG